jgi:pimeloyl-ACP methyl ester carboxylesterase
VPEFVVSGYPLVIAQGLAAIERFFELARAEQQHRATQPTERLPEALSSIQGHYCRLRTQHDEAVIFYEEAGQGPPLVLLHTAGADSRQYLALLADPQMQAQWLMYAFDMPFHGRSLPTESWSETTYSLSQADYLAWCLTFVESVVGAPAAVMGCSMGAAIAIVLAASGSPWIRGILALEAPDRAPGRLDPHLFHAAVNQSLHNPAYVRGLMSPSSPLRMKNLACWYYAQGGPGVYSGDLDFYSMEYDGARLAEAIDTRRCPVFLLTGEYDYSASPAATRRLAALIPGAHFEILEGLGHFPMTENPAKFRHAVQPVLARLRTIMTSS